VTLLGVLAAALAAERVGLSMALGTFLLGTTLSISPFRDRIAASVEPIKNIIFALFFLSVGLSIDLEIVASAWAPLLLNTLVILVLKFGIVLLLALAGRLQRSDAVKLSVALAQRGEFGFVLFAAAQTHGLMSPTLTALASILITISMLATPFLVRYGALGRLASPDVGATGRTKDGFSWGRYYAPHHAYSGRSLAEGFNIAMRSVAQRHFWEAACTLIQLSWARFQRLWGPS
jgi:glutathione-regulated potassium-efflux system ancillary protein KefC